MGSEASAPRPGSPPPGEDFAQTLRTHRRAWDDRPLLRGLYRDWHAQVESELADVSGPCVELGAGIGAFKDFRPATVATDLHPTPWADAVADAQDLPYDDEAVGNLVMIDVLHHVPSPGSFFREAQRVLAPGGRVVMVEPYCSPVSTLAYRFLHEEPTDLSADPLGGRPLSSGAPYDANVAVPTLIFWRHLDRFRATYPDLEVRTRRRLAVLAYPLSGGFSRPERLPRAVAGRLARLERHLGFAAPLMAFRCLVTLERRN